MRQFTVIALLLLNTLTFNIVAQSYNERLFDYDDDETVLIADPNDNDTRIRTINSVIDPSVANAGSRSPFEFDFILGAPKSSIKFVAQTIDPTRLGRPEWTTSTVTLPMDAFFIAGIETVRGVKFYKGIYEGKAFFIPAVDVNITPESQHRIDILQAAPPHIQDIFFQRSLALNREVYRQDIELAQQTRRRLARNGIAILHCATYNENSLGIGTGLSILFYNPTDTPISAVSVTFQGYTDHAHKFGNTITKQLSYQILPGKTRTYEFTYAWRGRNNVSQAQILSLTITYADGKSRTIKDVKPLFVAGSDTKYIATTDHLPFFE